MSSSKTVTNILLGIMVSNGHLNFSEKVSTYWPKFAKNGKENLKVEDVLRHECGMHKFDAVLKPEDCYTKNIKQNSLG